MIKKTLFTIGLLALIIGAIFLVHKHQEKVMEATQMPFPPFAVASAPAKSEQWSQQTRAVGTVVVVRGADLSVELSGKVTEIRFESGQQVEEGDVLLTLDTSQEEANLAAALAQAELAEITLKRANTLRENGTNSEAELDQAKASFKQAVAEVKALQATIARKQLRAPFSGQLGLRQVDLGEYLNTGTPVVLLQSLESVKVHFSLPQAAIGRIGKGMTVRFESDAWPGQVFDGKIVATAASIDEATRMIEVEALLPNPKQQLTPGMFVDVLLEEPTPRKLVAVPATSVIYASYGNSIFVAKPMAQGEGLMAEQRFVRLGEKRGDFIEVISGVHAGDRVITDGAFKLFPGAPIDLQDAKAASSSMNPQPRDT